MKQIISRFLDRFKKAPEGHEIFRGYYHEGKAVYTYIPNPNDENHIFDGDFKVRYEFGDGKFAEAKGTYVNNIKQGHWEFVRYGFSTRRTLSVDFKDGQIVGPVACMLSEKGIGHKQVSNLSLTIKDGKIVGPVTGIVRNEELPENYQEDPQMVNQLNFILGECFSVIQAFAPRGHVNQEISL